MHVTWSNTRSLSPSSNCIFFSSVAQRVSRGFPRGMIISSEKMPTHFNPLRSWSFCSLSLKMAFEEIAHVRSFSEVDDAPRIFCVALLKIVISKIESGLVYFLTSFQGIGDCKKLCSSSLRNPISTRSLTNSKRILPVSKSWQIWRRRSVAS